MMKIFDTHAHYSDAVYDADRESVLKKIYEDGVTHAVLIGAGIVESKSEKELAREFNKLSGVPKLFFTIGDHPDEIPKIDPDSEEGTKYLLELENLCKDGRGIVEAVAIGEIGLDYHGDFKTDEDYKNQAKWFIAEIDLAKKLGLPIVVHSRDACKDTLELVKNYAKDLSGIIHCFSYEKEIAAEYVKLGYYVGVGGTVTFKNGRKIKEVVEHIPIENIVTETDAPWLSPMPYRGERNDSSRIKYVIEEIARLKNVDTEYAMNILYDNAFKVYRLKR